MTLIVHQFERQLRIKNSLSCRCIYLGSNVLSSEYCQILPNPSPPYITQFFLVSVTSGSVLISYDLELQTSNDREHAMLVFLDPGYLTFLVPYICGQISWFLFSLLMNRFHAVYVPHFIHSSTEGHLYCIQFLPLMSRVAVNIYVY